MSRDIRSFFTTKKVQKPKVVDDDDVIPESPDVQIKTKKREVRKKRILSDSDDDTVTNKMPNDKSKTDKKKTAPDLKEAKVTDMFGGPIKRSQPIVSKPKKKTETGIHSDDDFDQSLIELDEAEIVGDKTKIASKHVVSVKDKKNDNKSEDKIDKNHKNDKIELNIDKNHKNNELKGKFDQNLKTKSEHKGNKHDIKETNYDEKNLHTKDTKKDIVDIKGDVKDTKRERKRDFSDSNTSYNEEHDGKAKKRKLNLNESVLTDEERHERRLHCAASYQKYLNRSGPVHLGAKEMPEGTPNCLSSCAILITGVLDSFEREEVMETIKKYGGSIKNSISKKVTHVLAGTDAGEAKMAKAKDLGIKIINEDEFLQLIIDNSKQKDSKSEIKKEKSPRPKANNKTEESMKKVVKEEVKIKKEKSEVEKALKVENTKVKVEEVKPKVKAEKIEKMETESSTESPGSNNVNAMMWVDKYKPQNIKQIIGQHGDASNVKKLSNWLTKWYASRKAKLPKPSPWAKNDDGGYFKAALLSGPPGVGKTTTVSLVCKELGFDMVEFNASDTRNKTLIKEQIGELLTTTSLSGYAKGDTGKQAVSKKHVLVMDEVDGMAGNEDRGGLQELISLIRSTSVPIICMCNDRNSQKMRSFVNYCYDLRFNRPRVDQIKSAMMSICFKEGIKIPPDVLTQLIVSSNQDVRQTLHLLSMWAAEPTLADADRLRRDVERIKKDFKLGPWDVIRKVFTEQEHRDMSLNEKSDLFFYDYSLSPLFVQENYLSVVPHCPKQEVLDRLSKAADSISFGDLIDARIRRNQAWSLLPMQAMFSSVIPGHELSGHLGGQVQFPGWLGKNSRASKLHRLCQDIHAHTRLSTSGSKSSIYLDYASHLRDAIVTPMVKAKSEGVGEALRVLEAYHLLREDLDSLTELSLWPGQRNPMDLVESKVKAAMTRTYNKNSTALPYAPASIKRGKGKVEEDADEEGADEEEEDIDSDPENDALIMKKKNNKTEKSSSSNEKAGTSKEKGKKKRK